MRGIRRESARPGVGAIRLQGRDPRNPERGKRIKVGLLNTNKINRMRQNEVWKFRGPGTEISSIPLKTRRESREEEEAGGIEKQPGT